MKTKKIEKIKLTFHTNDEIQDLYDEAKAEYIANYEEFEPGGFFIPGHYKKRPDVGAAKWSEEYKDDPMVWYVQNYDFRNVGIEVDRIFADKINQIIDHLNTRKEEC